MSSPIYDDDDYVYVSKPIKIKEETLHIEYMKASTAVISSLNIHIMYIIAYLTTLSINYKKTPVFLKEYNY